MSEKLGIRSLFTKKTTKKTRNRTILRILLLFSILFLLAFSFDSIRRILILLLLVIINAVFAFVKRRIPFAFIRKHFYGIELILLCTVAISVTLGSKIGATMGALLMVVNYLAESRASNYFVVTVTLYTLIGYFAYFFRSYDFAVLGIIITIIYNLLTFIFTKLIGANTVSLIIFNIVNITFNIILFVVYGDLMLRILS